MRPSDCRRPESSAEDAFDEIVGIPTWSEASRGESLDEMLALVDHRKQRRCRGTVLAFVATLSVLGIVGLFRISQQELKGSVANQKEKDSPAYKLVTSRREGISTVASREWVRRVAIVRSEPNSNVTIVKTSPDRAAEVEVIGNSQLLALFPETPAILLDDEEGSGLRYVLARVADKNAIR